MNPKSMVFGVDDDPGVRKSIAWMLESNGINSRLFGDPVQFLDEAIVDCPSCVILDLQMPGMSGLEVLNRMSERAELLMPVITLTDAGSISAAVQSMKLGACDSLEKPFSPEILLQRVCDALEQDAQHRAAAARRNDGKQRLDRLSERERQVLNLLCECNSTKQIAAKLNISGKTVSIHRWHLMKKLEVNSAIEATQLVSLAEAA